MLRVGTQGWPLCGSLLYPDRLYYGYSGYCDAKRRGLRSHAKHRNEKSDARVSPAQLMRITTFTLTVAGKVVYSE